MSTHVPPGLEGYQVVGDLRRISLVLLPSPGEPEALRYALLLDGSQVRSVDLPRRKVVSTRLALLKRAVGEVARDAGIVARVH